MNFPHRSFRASALRTLIFLPLAFVAFVVLADEPKPPVGQSSQIAERTQTSVQSELAAAKKHMFDMKNLIAWCIVPYDGKHRGPEERAAMLEKLGFTKFA